MIRLARLSPAGASWTLPRKSEKQALRDRYIDFLKTYGLPEPLGEMFFRMLYDRFPAVKEGGGRR